MSTCIPPIFISISLSCYRWKNLQQWLTENQGEAFCRLGLLRLLSVPCYCVKAVWTSPVAMCSRPSPRYRLACIVSIRAACSVMGDGKECWPAFFAKRGSFMSLGMMRSEGSCAAPDLAPSASPGTAFSGNTAQRRISDTSASSTAATCRIS